jgi:hypothetical protein
MPFVKGKSGNPKGRKPGTPNKITADVKEAILASFDTVGGADYLVEQAAKNPQAYLTLIGKVLPLQVNANLDGRISISVVQRAPNRTPA